MLRRGLDEMEVARSMSTLHPSHKQSYSLQLDKVAVSEQCNTSPPSTMLTQPPDFSNNDDLCGSGRANIQVPTAENFHVQLSEACQKRFIIFDQSKHNSTVILHPDLFNDFSAFAPSSSKDVVDFFHHCRANGDLATRNFFGPPFITEKVSRSSEKRDAVSSTFAASPESKLDGLHVQNTDDDLLLVSHNGGVHTCRDFNEGVDSDFTEDPKDIDVLLSLDGDNLLSEGCSYSASKLSSNCSPAPIEDPKVHSCGVVSQKRKFDEYDLDVEADGDSNFGEKEEDQHGAHGPLDMPTSTLKVEVGACGETTAVKRVKQGRCRDKLSNNDLGSLGQIEGSGKTKIKAGVQHLKKVIPGVDNLDSEGVLRKTVQYVKLLQDKLRKLEEERDTRV